MPHKFLAALALSLLLAAPAFAATADRPAAHKPAAHKHVVHRHVTHKRRVSRHWHDYGFLPGYVPPEVAEREREWRYWQSGPHFYGPAWPRFYRGRWNGGGFGPCYVSTPIGYMWTCGR
jgi:hypothetical protein